MELLFLFVLITVVWLLWLPSRIAGTLRRHRFAAAAVLGVLAVAGVALLQINPRTDTPVDYASGDAALRELLDITEVVTRR